MATIFEKAQEVLELAVTVFAAEGVALPARQIIYPSPIPADCAQIAVLMSGSTVYPPMEEPSRCAGGIWLATYTIAVFRDVPKGAQPSRTGAAPSPAAMTAVAEMTSRDADVMTVLAAAFDTVDMVDIRVGAPAGGIVVTELDVRVPL